jgi:hypothetical protein
MTTLDGARGTQLLNSPSIIRFFISILSLTREKSVCGSRDGVLLLGPDQGIWAESPSLIIINK